MRDPDAAQWRTAERQAVRRDLAVSLALASPHSQAGTVPWHRVLLVWSAGIGARRFSPTPGGIGAVEAAMITVLVVAGLHPAQAVAAVLIYRLVNSKSAVTAVLFVHGSIRELSERSRREA